MADLITPPPGYKLDDDNVVLPPGYKLDDDITPPITSTGGLLPAVAHGAEQAIEGFGSGVASSLVGLRDLAAKGYQKATAVQTPTGTQQPFGALPDVPAVMREAGTTPADASLPFKGGKVLEQAGEFFLPGSTVAKGAEIAGGLFKAGKAAKYLNPTIESLVRVGGEAASAGGVRAIQTGGNKDEALNAAITAGVFTAPFASVNTALKMVKPSSLYGPSSLMTHIPDRFKGQRFDEIVGQAIDNNITVSKMGLARAKGTEATSTAARDLAISQNANTLVDNGTVYEPLRGLQDIATRFGETSVARAIDRRIAAVEASHGGSPAVPASTMQVPGPNPKATLTPAGMPRTVNIPGSPAVPGQLTVSEAQQLKDFGQGLAADMYAKLGDSVGAQKIREELARGFMRSIEEVIPEIKGMNRNIQNTKVIRQGIEDYINSNPDLVNMNTLIWSVVSPKTAAVSLLGNPRFRSALAIAAHNNTMAGIGATGGKIIIGTEAGLAPPMPQRPGVQ